MSRRIVKPKPAATIEALNFDGLVKAIADVDRSLAAHAARTVNLNLTLRNWTIGFYIRVYEQKGADRAAYGERLVEALAARLRGEGLRRMDERELRRFRAFHAAYPGIRETLPPEIRSLMPDGIANSVDSKVSLSDAAAIRETVSPGFTIPFVKLLTSLSFSHFAELITIEDPLKRAFYEIECIRGNWSVRSLKRQIATLYFERSGLSKDKEKLAAMIKAGVEEAEPRLAIRDPYIFEFLGLRPKDAVAESDLEAALVENLREFLLELGHGFCLEAQQKCIAIGRTKGFVDLVFYHRILKCHVLVELKVDEFTHENIGQLNTYVTWYRRHMMSAGDNPPVGLLLCAEKDHALVEYATAGMDNQLFVSKYQLELPNKGQLERFLMEKRREISGTPS